MPMIVRGHGYVGHDQLMGKLMLKSRADQSQELGKQSFAMDIKPERDLKTWHNRSIETLRETYWYSLRKLVQREKTRQR